MTRNMSASGGRGPDTYAVILVGGDCSENGLAEYERFVCFLVELLDGRVGETLGAVLAAPEDEVDARLVLVHGVQNDLLSSGGKLGCLLWLVFVCAAWATPVGRRMEEVARAVEWTRAAEWGASGEQQSSKE